MALGEFGRNSALKVKREIKSKLINQGYKIPSHVIPMKEVVDYLNIKITNVNHFCKNNLKMLQKSNICVIINSERT